MKKKIDFINTKLPLQIGEVSWEDPIFHIAGKKFKFNARTEWRLILPTGKVAGCYDNDVQILLNSLIGQKIASIQSQSKYFLDPVFLFINGEVLEFFSSSTSEETWTLHLTDEDILIESNEQLVV